MSTAVVEAGSPADSLIDTVIPAPALVTVNPAVIPAAIPVRARRITFTQVRAVLEDTARRFPRRRDKPAGEELPARYVSTDRPDCLIAVVLARLGYSVGQLKALDAEHPVGDPLTSGVRVAESRHPALRRLDATAKALLHWVQERQDAGQEWGRIAADAFRPRGWFSWKRTDMARRPWLYV